MEPVSIRMLMTAEKSATPTKAGRQFLSAPRTSDAEPAPLSNFKFMLVSLLTRQLPARVIIRNLGPKCRFATTIMPEADALARVAKLAVVLSRQTSLTECCPHV